VESPRSAKNIPIKWHTLVGAFVSITEGKRYIPAVGQGSTHGRLIVALEPVNPSDKGVKSAAVVSRKIEAGNLESHFAC
jgi:hypothetical protein